MNKVVIIGCGNVGMSYAYALVNQKNSVEEIVLIDNNQTKAEGEAMDLNHSLPFSPNHLTIKSGTYQDCNNAKIIVICAGAKQLPGETRLDLITKNKEIFQNIIANINNTNFNGIIIVASNPVDIMSYITYKNSKLKPSQVIGTGTTLDTSRLRYIISKKLTINPKNIHVYVLGEHGDSEFIAWTSGLIGTSKISEFLTQEDMDQITKEVKDSAYQIIDKKGNTSYGIGTCLMRITKAILDNEDAIITTSVYDYHNDIYISKASIINKDGVRGYLNTNLSESEKAKEEVSIQIIKNVISNNC